MKTVSLVGSTGSIGRQAVEVIEADPGAYRVIALGAATSVDALADQAGRLRPERVALVDAGRAGEGSAEWAWAVRRRPDKSCRGSCRTH